MKLKTRLVQVAASIKIGGNRQHLKKNYGFFKEKNRGYYEVD